MDWKDVVKYIVYLIACFIVGVVFGIVAMAVDLMVWDGLYNTKTLRDYLTNLKDALNI